MHVARMDRGRVAVGRAREIHVHSNPSKHLPALLLFLVLRSSAVPLRRPSL